MTDETNALEAGDSSQTETGLGDGPWKDAPTDASPTPADPPIEGVDAGPIAEAPSLALSDEEDAAVRKAEDDRKAAQERAAALRAELGSLGDPLGDRRRRAERIAALEASVRELVTDTRKAIVDLQDQDRAAFKAEQARIARIESIGQELKSLGV